MNTKKVMFGLLFCLATVYLYGQNYYMYVNGQKHIFEVSETKMLVKSNTLDAEGVKNEAKRTTAGIIKNTYDLDNHLLTLVEMQNEDRENLMELQKQWDTKEDVIYVSPVLLDATGREIGGFTNQIIIRLKSVADSSLLTKSVAPYQIKDIKQSEFNELSYMLTLEKCAVKNAMQTANKLHETGLFEYAEPNLIHFLELTTADEHYSKQWGLKNTGQSGGTSGMDIKVEQAWGITTGSPNIRVAVIDVGVQLNHPDLVDNLLSGIDYTGNNSNGAPANGENHGTLCAGIIAARANNTIGIAGVAYNCKILPIRIATTNQGWTTTTTDRIVSGINWARNNEADVISMSFNCYSSSDLTIAISEACTLGRNNKGCVLVAGTGNDNLGYVPYPPANLDSVLAVGAINRNGQRWVNSPSGSNYGNALDVVAPGVDIWSTTINSGYTSDNGTSFATAMVSGVAALILSVRPDLYARQVRNAIEQNCNKNLPGWSVTHTRTNGTWNDSVGYGLVNAYEAVNSVTIRISGPKELCVGFPSKTFTVTNAPAGAAWGKSSNLLLSDLGTSALVSAIGNGSGWVSINSDSIELVRYNVSVCSSVPVFDSIEGPDEVTPGSETHYYQAHFDNATPSNYEWWVYGAPSSWYVIGNNSDSSTGICFIGEATYAVYVYGSNACGSDGGQLYVAAYSRGGQAYIIYPNPVNDILTISAAQQAGSNAKTAQLLDIRLYDLQGNLTLRKTANNSADIQLDVSGLRDGNYFLHIYEGLNAMPYMKQIVVRH